jgi:hypothetical protein
METAVRSLGRAALFACAALLVACGGSDDGSPQKDTQLSGLRNQAESACEDQDGDGFGEGCKAGPDCDDNDDTHFEACGACFDTEEGCECEPGTAPVKCTLEENVESNLCLTGLRSCRDGLWTACEGTAQFQ